MKINDCIHQQGKLKKDDGNMLSWCKKACFVCPNKPKHCEWYKSEKKYIIKKIKRRF